MTADPAEIIDFWLNDVGEEGWYNSTPDLDREIRHRFGQDWRMARAGAYADWILKPAPALALLLLLDQFPRNMFRGEAEAFASDGKALQLAKRALVLGHDLRVEEKARQFFYMPLMHSECLSDQERCCRMFHLRTGPDSADNLLHARVHREIIRRFGRFPTRNESLGRPLSEAEARWLDSGGYSQVLEELAD
ncbi:DUF924 domain-containing protein [Paroceanicella profunda]|uniref:DUF924 domain-containing protein n=1 Tax=Paroceanicella profunda TaxID=2579971 RepID=A0A5B8FHV0_9RHOB|nr:DUF924 family protein [Paroceanicella profunda]QDL92627.1 DUF924 domain-containing protein [Paroceanicella profunda]